MTGAPHVLLVEDEDVVCRAVTRVLTRGGYDVSSTPSISGAQEILAERRDFAAIICDLTLSDGSGIELLEWLPAARPELVGRTLVLTGYAIEPFRDHPHLTDWTRVLAKPIAPQRLLEQLAAVVAEAVPTIDVGACGPNAAS